MDEVKTDVETAAHNVGEPRSSSDEREVAETTEATEADAPDAVADLPEIQEMAKAGILFGRKRSVTHPKMRKYVFTTRTGFEIIDLEKTKTQIAKAEEFLREVAGTGQSVLFVGTRPEARDLVKAAAEEFNFPFVTQRWLGGTLTNFDSISTRINYYIKLKEDQAGGKLDKYKKKERVAMEKEAERMDRLFGGLERLERLPAALIVVSADAHDTAIREAKIKNIPVIVIANTSANPDMIDYVIPANDTSRASITYILAKLTTAIKEGKAKVPAKVAAPEKKEGPANEAVE
ncbi:MAG: 30S ribosomal protein S2 [Candidatus Harrisonbacteria bacterium CG10_big_fil_rev_8_21_14_0_10_49_15]|uniref:Small ribosomal subunit protein uS2 n=1 Tax=Candidatus Harrisonbacteria bacterium CG10_big_fil_rev_8_21_14_0_10_49_15 TaxID=1974587 RepID=A0A2H0UMI9_9BACT|nr:MAG: 30S ribosomal protein S2 [Candidatus Harrisonbacteria bacterium CG10_big_fil_rev_8_21_14_0_10_49_15]